MHCAIAVGSRPATKPKKLRSAARRQLRVPIVALRVPARHDCRKALDLGGGEIGQRELGHGSPSPLGDEPEEQAPSVAVGANGMDRGISLLDHPFIKEGMQQPGERVDAASWLHPFLNVKTRWRQLCGSVRSLAAAVPG